VRKVCVPLSALSFGGEVIHTVEQYFIGIVLDIYTGEGSSAPKITVDFGRDLGVQVVAVEKCEDITFGDPNFLPTAYTDSDMELENETLDIDPDWEVGSEMSGPPDSDDLGWDLEYGEEISHLVGELEHYGEVPANETFEERYAEHN
jgi:hypothetical protein